MCLIDMTREYSGVLAGLENTGWAITQGLSSSFVGMLLDWGNCEQEGATGPMSEADTASCDMAWRTAFGLAAVLYIGQAVVFAIWGSFEPLKIVLEGHESMAEETTEDAPGEAFDHG